MLKMRKLVRRILKGEKKRRPLHRPAFAGVGRYWENRYAAGGASGAGSLGRLAEFKAQVLNDFVEQHSIQTILELGCGDGSQLSLARYPSYVGIDLSQTAIERCRDLFRHDPSKRFFHVSERAAYDGIYDLVLSLDVIFHLVEDDVYRAYMFDLCRHAAKNIIVYSSNYEDHLEQPWGVHVRHRRFSDDVKAQGGGWRLVQKIDNPYPLDPKNLDDTSFSDFYFFEPEFSAAEQIIGPRR